MKEKIFIGIDISKSQLDIYVRPTGQSWKTGNNEKEIRDLVKKLKELEPTLIVLEATGGLENSLSGALTSEQMPVVVINPRQVRDFAKAIGRLAKTDAIDAEVIAHFGEAVKPKLKPLSDKETQDLKAFNTRRREIINILTAEKNRYQSAPPCLKSDIKEHIDWLQHRLADIDNSIASKIKSNPVWKEKDEIIQSMDGIGPVISHTIISGLPELGQVNNRKIAALIGVAPYNCDSGVLKGRRIIWGGRSEVRSVLYMGALRATRCNSVISEFYNRLIKAGKAPKVAIAACMRKIITILNTMIKNKTLWKFAGA